MYLLFPGFLPMHWYSPSSSVIKVRWETPIFSYKCKSQQIKKERVKKHTEQTCILFIGSTCAVSVLVKFTLKSTLGAGYVFIIIFNFIRQSQPSVFFTAAWLTLSVPKNLYCWCNFLSRLKSHKDIQFKNISYKDAHKKSESKQDMIWHSVCSGSHSTRDIAHNKLKWQGTD